MEWKLVGKIAGCCGILATIAFAGGCGQDGGDASSGGSGKLLINGAGATFPALIYQKWAAEYAKADPSVQINYQSMGSGAWRETNPGWNR